VRGTLSEDALTKLRTLTNLLDQVEPSISGDLHVLSTTKNLTDNLVNLLADLLVVGFKAHELSGELAQTTGALASKAAEGIVKPVLLQQRSAMGQGEFQLVQKYLSLSQVALKNFMAAGDWQSSCRTYQVSMETVDGLGAIELFQERLKRAVPDEILGLFL